MNIISFFWHRKAKKEPFLKIVVWDK